MFLKKQANFNMGVDWSSQVAITKKSPFQHIIHTLCVSPHKPISPPVAY